MEKYPEWKRFSPELNLIKDFKNWMVIVRPKQVTLGSALLLPKRAFGSFAEMHSEEALELPNVCGWYEQKLREVYRADKFNYVAAMMKDPYFHFHVFPRYEREIDKFSKKWIDEDWPNVIVFRGDNTELDVIVGIKEDLKEI